MNLSQEYLECHEKERERGKKTKKQQQQQTMGGGGEWLIFCTRCEGLEIIPETAVWTSFAFHLFTSGCDCHEYRRDISHN